MAAPDRRENFEYRLQHAAVGVAMLDAQRRLVSGNALALRLFGGAEQMIGADILALHPEPARPKIRALIDEAAEARDGAAATIVATRIGNLLAKISVLRGGDGQIGYCLMFFMLEAAPERAPSADFLLKLPAQKGNGAATTLIDIDEVAALTAQGHYCDAVLRDGAAFCPRSLASLEARLDPRTFWRAHRRHLVNLRHVRAAERIDGQWLLKLADAAGTRIPVGRRKVEEMRRRLAL